MRIILQSSHYSHLARLAGHKFNSHKLHDWLLACNRDNLSTRDETLEPHQAKRKGSFENHKSASKRKSHASSNEIWNIPCVTFESIQELIDFTTNHPCPYPDEFSAVLHGSHDIHYELEILKSMLASNHYLSIANMQAIVAKMAEDEFMQASHCLIVAWTDKVLSTPPILQDIEGKRVVMALLGRLVDNSTLINNDWLVQCLNAFAEKCPLSKEDNYYKQNLLSKVVSLDFSKVKPVAPLKMELRKHQEIIEESPSSFYWQIDIALYAHKHQIPLAMVEQNVCTALTILTSFMHNLPSVVFITKTKEKNIHQLVVLHNDQPMETKLATMLSIVLQETCALNILDEKSMTHLYLSHMLGEDSSGGKRKNKI